jgi:CDP-diacylglycerol--glycerol-3-phosphate 3-phosphatidyltransferase
MSTSTPGDDGRSNWNVPNTLTWLRILMIPAILALFYLLPYPWADPAACAAFALAGITDTLDGYYARKLGQTSRLGAFLDPVADKLIVAAALVLIVSKDPRWFVVIVAVVIIGREIAVSALRRSTRPSCKSSGSLCFCTARTFSASLRTSWGWY